MLGGRGYRYLASHDLDSRDDGEDEHQHGEQLPKAPFLLAVVAQFNVRVAKGLRK